MITLKHICREYKVDPYPMRQRLRKLFKGRRMNQRWKWDDNDPILTDIRKVAKELRDATSRAK